MAFRPQNSDLALMMGRKAQLSVFSYDPMDGLEGYYSSDAIYAPQICILKPMMLRNWSVCITH